MRTALYARVSTDKQAEKYGIPSQIEALRKRCLEKGWTPVPDRDKDAFADDGYSGGELDRPALNRLREADRKGLLDKYEREKIRERTLRGSREKARQGKVVSAGAMPFGYRYNKEQGELEKRKAQLEGQLRLRFLTENQEAQIKIFSEKISVGLDNLDFAGKQELLRLLVEKIVYDGQNVEILTIINPNEQLHPVHRRG